MQIETTDSKTQSTTETDLSPTTIFRLLADRRRRYVLHYLSRRAGAVPLDELAEQILLREGDANRDRFERVLTDLHHCHLPRLADAGVVRYDPERETVALRGVPEEDQLAPYLALAVGEDL